jgi:alanyl-tRNA synthetase
MENELDYPGLTAYQIGQIFLNYYQDLGYAFIPESSLLDDSVPMSFVMSAGMVQFETMAGRKRDGDNFVLIQNCFRYFDLERIGKSNTHLSLFQMPGAFDFGPVDQFITIRRIWDLLTLIYGLKPESLFVTYFNGGQVDGQILLPDDKALSAWESVGLQTERIVGLGVESNYWQQNSQAVGSKNATKRGANTEVFYDKDSARACSESCKPGCPCGRFVEVLNTLFITHCYDEQQRTIVPLDEPFTEIVIGLERMTMLLQGKESVFEIDSIYPLVEQLRHYKTPLPNSVVDVTQQSLERVLVDHLRALLFLIADGAPPPGKGGRARLMRILIRELLTSQWLLGISEPDFFNGILRVALNIYPLLAVAETKFLEYITDERERFERTVERGMWALESSVRKTGIMISDTEMNHLAKKHGVPSSLLRYRLWQRENSIIDK